MKFRVATYCTPRPKGEGGRGRRERSGRKRFINGSLEPRSFTNTSTTTRKEEIMIVITGATGQLGQSGHQGAAEESPRLRHCRCRAQCGKSEESRCTGRASPPGRLHPAFNLGCGAERRGQSATDLIQRNRAARKTTPRCHRRSQAGRRETVGLYQCAACRYIATGTCCRTQGD